MDTPATNTTTSPAGTNVDLLIGGMTCASCAARIEKRLNKLDGVKASVNYATEQAKVTVTDGVTVDDAFSTPCSPAPPWPSRAFSSSPTACACGGSKPAESGARASSVQ